MSEYQPIVCGSRLSNVTDAPINPKSNGWNTIHKYPNTLPTSFFLLPQLKQCYLYRLQILHMWYFLYLNPATNASTSVANAPAPPKCINFPPKLQTSANPSKAPARYPVLNFYKNNLYRCLYLSQPGILTVSREGKYHKNTPNIMPPNIPNISSNGPCIILDSMPPKNINLTDNHFNTITIYPLKISFQAQH